MKEYRTDGQFTEIMGSMTNGNWTRAGEEVAEYGFYAGDLDTKLEDYRTTYGYDYKYMYELAVNFMYALERAR